jgi:ribosomal protein L37E
MSVDLNQLPIPDWGLHCPRCQYDLRGLMRHQCPECGLEFDIAEVVRPWNRIRDPWFTGEELPIPEWGLQCRECGTSLCGITTYVCSHCGAAVPLPAKLRPHSEWFAVTPEQGGSLSKELAEMVLLEHDIPHRRVSSSQLYGELHTQWYITAASEFYFDVLFVLTREQQRIEASRADAERKLNCQSCEAENPGNFLTCWQCGSLLSSTAKDF